MFFVLIIRYPTLFSIQTREVQQANNNLSNTLSTRASSESSREQVNRTVSNSTNSSKDSGLSTTASFEEEFTEVIHNIDEDLQLRIFHEALVGEDDFLAEVEIPLRSQVLGRGKRKG